MANNIRKSRIPSEAPLGSLLTAQSRFSKTEAAPEISVGRPASLLAHGQRQAARALRASAGAGQATASIGPDTQPSTISYGTSHQRPASGFTAVHIRGSKPQPQNSNVAGNPLREQKQFILQSELRTSVDLKSRKEVVLVQTLKAEQK